MFLANHNKYDHGHSSGYKTNGTKVTFNEGPYSINGYYSIDTMSVCIL